MKFLLNTKYIHFLYLVNTFLVYIQHNLFFPYLLQNLLHKEYILSFLFLEQLNQYHTIDIHVLLKVKMYLLDKENTHFLFHFAHNQQDILNNSYFLEMVYMHLFHMIHIPYHPLKKWNPLDIHYIYLNFHLDLYLLDNLYILLNLL